jgi:streptogramin lyase
MKKTTSQILWILIAAVALLTFQTCSKNNDAIAPTINATAIANKTAAISAVPAGQLVVTTIARRNLPNRICHDDDGTLYVTAVLDHRIYRITQTGSIRVFYENPLDYQGIKVAKSGSVFVALGSANAIGKISSSGVPDRIQISRKLKHPNDIAIADDGTMYIADAGHYRILKVVHGTATILAGKGIPGFQDSLGTKAAFSNLTSIKLGHDGNLYVVDGYFNYSNVTIRKITPDGMVSTLKPFSFPISHVLDITVNEMDKDLNPTPGKESIFVAYTGGAITHMDATGHETPLTQPAPFGYSDGPLKTAKFGFPTGITAFNNALYIVDNTNNAIRKIYRK